MNYNISMIKLVMRINKCVREGSSVEEYIRLWEELTEKINEVQGIIINYGLIDNERIIENVVLKFVSSFAESYPEEFMKQDLQGKERYVIRAMDRAIFQGRSTAEILMKKRADSSIPEWSTLR